MSLHFCFSAKAHCHSAARRLLLCPHRSFPVTFSKSLSFSLRGSLLSIVFRHPFSSHLLLTWKYFPELHFITISLVFLHPTWACHHFLDFKLLWAILGNSFSFSLLCLFPRVGSTTAVILKASLLPLLHGHCPFFHLAHATTGK